MLCVWETLPGGPSSWELVSPGFQQAGGVLVLDLSSERSAEMVTFKYRLHYQLLVFNILYFTVKKDFKMERGNSQINHFKEFPRAEDHEFLDWKSPVRNQPDRGKKTHTKHTVQTSGQKREWSSCER